MVEIHRRAALCVLAAPLAAAAGFQENEQKGRRMAEQLRFLTRVEIQDGKLLVHYGVENPSQWDLYLLNRVANRRRDISPDNAYIQLEPEGRTVWVYKKVPDIPPGLSPSMLEAPYVTPVRGGRRFAETIHIPLPVGEYLAYDPRPAGSLKERPATYAGVRVTIGYYWSVAGMKERTEKVNGVEVILPEPPPRTRLQFGELASRPMAIQVPVLERVEAASDIAQPNAV